MYTEIMFICFFSSVIFPEIKELCLGFKFYMFASSEEKAMYSTELEKLTKEKEEWKRKAQRLEDQASALQVNLPAMTHYSFIYLI